MSCCVISSILRAHGIVFAILTDRVTRVLHEKSGHAFVQPPPSICAKSTTLWEGVVTFGIANFPSAKGWDAARFSTLVGVP